jgi:hypothetical protein
VGLEYGRKELGGRKKKKKVEVEFSKKKLTKNDQINKKNIK